MPILNTEDLAAIPTGGAVYYMDRKYTRKDPDWWSVGDSDSKTIRDFFLRSAVSSGKVLADGEQEVKVGAVIRGNNLWSIVTALPDDRGRVLTNRFYHEAGAKSYAREVGALHDMNHYIDLETVQEKIVTLTPQEYAQILMEGFKRETEASAANAAANAANAANNAAIDNDYRRAKAELDDYERLREMLRNFLAA